MIADRLRRATACGAAACTLACAFAVWLVAAEPASAQDESAAAQPLSVLRGDEAAELRRIAEAPVPANASESALRSHFLAKDAATRRLSDPELRKRVLNDAMQRLPNDGRWPNQLAHVVREEGKAQEGRRLFDLAVARAGNPVSRVFYRANRMDAMVDDRVDGAADEVAAVRNDARSLFAGIGNSSDRFEVLAVLGTVARAEAKMAQQRQLLAEALAARTESLQRYREALDGLLTLPGNHKERIANLAASLATAQRARAAALSQLGRHAEAEAQLVEHLEFMPKHGLSAAFAAGAHHAMADLRTWQRRFPEAEQQLRLGITVLQGLNHPPSHPWQISKQRDLAMVLWVRGQHDEARRQITLIDESVKRDKAPAGRGRYPFERGLVYLSSGRAAEAAKLFEGLVPDLRTRLGPSHYYTARVLALQGAALWRSRDPAQREAAGELLKQSVLDLLSPRNADYLEDVSYRPELHGLIFTSYLEAMAERGGLQAMAAIGVADRLIAGSTAQAMADAALRAATLDPTLADLVRQEQDARNQLRALHQPAESSTGSTRSADSGDSRRIGELEMQRQQLQERIRARYPGYDRLIRPGTTSPTEVAQRLARDEVLLLALPTERSLYLWAVTADELPLFVRVEVAAVDIDGLVHRMRQGLDFGPGARAPRFDSQAAHELYRHVVEPVAARLVGRRHLVVATRGALARLPFAALLTSATAGSAQPPWLARQMAISQVPNLAAWLSLRQMPPGQAAPEALIAWADPRYSVAPARGAAAGRETKPERQGSGAPAVLRYEQLPPLPETRDEVTAIAVALKAQPDRDLLLGERATRESVLSASRSGQLARKRVVVFATHGLVAGDLPGLQQPALALAATSGTGDPLAALIGLDDVLGLKLNADWVVLSACNTAAGDGRAEEALTGLARGFLYAGTRSLLVTHWAVETESAKLLTIATFEHHAADARASKAESLRQAMLKVMAMPRYGHPAYWAPFALVGDGAR